MYRAIFVWDEKKNAANLAKHGVAFEEAVAVFDDSFHISGPDRVVEGELRWLTIGEVFGPLSIVMAHTFERDDEQEYVRIISARRAEPRKEEI